MDKKSTPSSLEPLNNIRIRHFLYYGDVEKFYKFTCNKEIEKDSCIHEVTDKKLRKSFPPDMYDEFIEECCMTEFMFQLGVSPKIYDYFLYNEKSGNILMEKYDTSLHEYIKKFPNCKKWHGSLRKLLKKVASVGHCLTDIKPKNVVINVERMEVKLIDFDPYYCKKWGNNSYELMVMLFALVCEMNYGLKENIILDKPIVEKDKMYKSILYDKVVVKSIVNCYFLNEVLEKPSIGLYELNSKKLSELKLSVENAKDTEEKLKLVVDYYYSFARKD